MIRQIAMLVAAILTFGGCSLVEAPEVEDCENRIFASLEVPASFERIKARSSVFDNLNPPAIWAIIEYNAVDAAGAPVHKAAVCKYALKNGAAELASGVLGAATGTHAEGTATGATATPAAMPTAAPTAVATQTPAQGPFEQFGTDAGLISEEDQQAALRAGERCLGDYCPCIEPDANSQMLCREIRAGALISDEVLAAAAASR
jgi:hypothetical protein